MQRSKGLIFNKTTKTTIMKLILTQVSPTPCNLLPYTSIYIRNEIRATYENSPQLLSCGFKCLCPVCVERVYVVFVCGVCVTAVCVYVCTSVSGVCVCLYEGECVVCVCACVRMCVRMYVVVCVCVCESVCVWCVCEVCVVCGVCVCVVCGV